MFVIGFSGEEYHKHYIRAKFKKLSSVMFGGVIAYNLVSRGLLSGLVKHRKGTITSK